MREHIQPNGEAAAWVEGCRGGRLVVGADVEGDGQDAVGRDAAARRVEGELADGDAHAVDAEVAQPQDARAVRHHDDVHVVLHAAPVLVSGDGERVIRR